MKLNYTKRKKSSLIVEKNYIYKAGYFSIGYLLTEAIFFVIQ